LTRAGSGTPASPGRAEAAMPRRAPASAAARRVARVRKPGPNIVAHVGIDLRQLLVDTAGLRAPVEPGQRLAEEIEAVRRPLAARIALVIVEEDARRRRRLVVVEIGAAEQVA